VITKERIKELRRALALGHMNGDLIQWLRGFGVNDHQDAALELCSLALRGLERDAADERADLLQAENDELRARMYVVLHAGPSTALAVQAFDRAQELELENERLRAALDDATVQLEGAEAAIETVQEILDNRRKIHGAPLQGDDQDIAVGVKCLYLVLLATEDELAETRRERDRDRTDLHALRLQSQGKLLERAERAEAERDACLRESIPPFDVHTLTRAARGTYEDALVRQLAGWALSAHTRK
jgi:cellobiose-specific phosphotransferase system component IIA